MGILEGEKMTLRYRGEQIHGKVMMENMASRRKVICNSFSFSDWECVTSIFSEHHSFSHSKAKKHYCSTIFLSSISHKTSQNLALIKTICGGEGKMSYKAKKKKKQLSSWQNVWALCNCHIVAATKPWQGNRWGSETGVARWGMLGWGLCFLLYACTLVYMYMFTFC